MESVWWISAVWTGSVWIWLSLLLFMSGINSCCFSLMKFGLGPCGSHCGCSFLFCFEAKQLFTRWQDSNSHRVSQLTQHWSTTTSWRALRRCVLAPPSLWLSTSAVSHHPLFPGSWTMSLCRSLTASASTQLMTTAHWQWRTPCQMTPGSTPSALRMLLGRLRLTLKSMSKVGLVFCIYIICKGQE